MIRLFFFISIFLVQFAYSQEYHPSLDISTKKEPEVVTIKGNSTLFYELHLTNFASDSILVKKLDVLNTVKDTVVVYSFGERELKSRQMQVGISQGHGVLIPPGTSSVIYLEVVIGQNQENALIHRLEVEILSGEKRHAQVIRGAALQFSNKTPLVLGPPLKGGFWAAIHDPSWERGHRRVFYIMSGKARLPGRFAIDFIKLDNEGKPFSGDKNIVTNWYSHGEDVLAVYDGVVASVRDDFPESRTLEDHPRYKAGRATGNYISIDLGNNRFAFYEHLLPRSIKVVPGQKVKKGDVIASLGFTGQATSPHLHFHIANNNSPLGAEGVSYVFDKFTVVGEYPDFDKFGKELWIPQTRTVINERPAPNTVIKFE